MPSCLFKILSNVTEIPIIIHAIFRFFVKMTKGILEGKNGDLEYLSFYYSLLFHTIFFCLHIISVYYLVQFGFL